MESTSRVTPLREPDLEHVPQPPANTEAEQALLGAILINNAAYGRVGEFLLPEHFANAVHGRIYAAIGKLLERGQIANPVTLKRNIWRAWPKPRSPSSTPSITAAPSTISICGAS